MLRNSCLIFLILLSAAHTMAQIGSLKLNNDSTFTGYLRQYHFPRDGSPGIEFWLTKKDKSPRKIHKTDISEYTLGDQTFKLFHNYLPFASENIYFELAEAKLESDGKVKLYRITAYKESLGGGAAQAAGGLVGSMIFQALSDENDMFILESKSGFLKALPSDKGALKESLKDFFPERYVDRYEQEKGTIRYNKVKDLVKLYNSK